jgi:tetratricopeptide (TPR) repeat protein
LYPTAALIVLVGLWRLRRRNRGPLAVALLFLGMLAPILGFLNVYLFVFSFVADHLQYLGSMALIAGLAAGGAVLGRRWPPFAGRGLAVAVLGVLAVLTWRQCRMYRDEETLYRVTLAQNPDAWLAHGNLGGLLVKAGRNEEAIEHLAIARRFHPEKIEINYNLGLAFLRLHRPAEAAPLFQAVLAMRPDDVESLGNLGDALVQQNRLAEAIPPYERAVQLRPELAGVQNNLGNALLATGRLEAAVAHLEQAVRLQPDNAEAHFNLGLVLAHLGRLPEAIAHDETALRLRPDDAGAHLNLGEALLQAGRTAEAVAHFREALRLDPTMTEARQGLEMAERNRPRGPLR